MKKNTKKRDIEGEKKTKSKQAREKKKEVVPNSGKEAPYPLVPSKKDKERHFARFLGIFKKLEITIPLGEALQQMPLYSKFLKDLLTKKGKYIHSATLWWKAIVVLSSRGSFQQNIRIQGMLASLAQLVLCQLERRLLT